MRGWALVCALGMVVPTWGWAQPLGMEPTGPSSQAQSLSPVVSWGHRNQVGLRVGLSMGYRLTIRYEDRGGSDPCDDAENKFCAQLAPLTLDSALGFGVSEGLELEGRFRLGVMTDFDGSRPAQLGVGIRGLGTTDRLRFVFSVAALLDVSGGHLRASRALDFQVRTEEGLHYDVTRTFGFYLCLGQGFSFLRNFSFVIDGSIGIQGRLPR